MIGGYKGPEFLPKKKDLQQDSTWNDCQLSHLNANIIELVQKTLKNCLNNKNKKNMWEKQNWDANKKAPDRSRQNWIPSSDLEVQLRFHSEFRIPSQLSAQKVCAQKISFLVPHEENKMWQEDASLSKL